LLRKNAFQQGLDPGTSSLAAAFVIDELSSTEHFLRAIEFTFSNHKEDEESRKALKALKQGKETIEQFNITFNSLLYTVDLSNASKCEIYADAIHPEIVNLGLQRGGWSGVTNLKARQAMAITLANDVAEVVALERSCAKGITARVEQKIINAPQRGIVPAPCVPVQAPPKLSEGTPMDLDAISAMVGFTYALFKAECLDAGICALCGGNYDSVHQDQGGFPIQLENQLTLGDKLMMWKDWGGYV
jgi:hypothetical protein